jgi:hypothetical protein
MNEISKVIGRDFIVAFFVPAIVLVAVSTGILYYFKILPDLLTIDPKDPLKDSTFIALITILISFLLMATNRNIFRALEGYWIFDVGRHLNYLQRWRFRRLHRRLKALNAEFKKHLAANKPFLKEDEFAKLTLRAAQRFPSTEDQVMFTAFGNTVRAFEDYPMVLYGVESITGWSRLTAVMAKDFREILDSRRATTDFWVNLWFVALFTIVEYFLIERLQKPFRGWGIPVAALGLALFAAQQARVAAQQWGEWVKASFDIYLPTLRSKWGFKRPDTFEAERNFWETLSRAITFRDAREMADLALLRKPEPPPSKEKSTEEEADEKED